MGDSGGAPLGAQANMETILGALAMFMEQQRGQPGGQGATKALKGVVDKIGRFDGKNITKFLRVYVCEMEVHQVAENRMIQTFSLAVVPEIRERVEEIREDENMTSWLAFEERLRDEYFDEDSERMTKRSFLDWVEQRPGNNMGPNELLRDFEKKYNQLPLAERRLLDTRKAELFLQAADDALEDRLLLLLGDRTTEGGFTNDWRRVEETVTLVAKQRRVRSRGVAARMDATPIPVAKAPKVSFAPTPSTSTSKDTKTVYEDTLDEIIKGIRDLRVEMTELKKSRGTQSSDATRTFTRRCIFCDEEDSHGLRGCKPYDEALKRGTVVFKDGKIHDASTNLPLSTNFGKGGMKTLLEDKMGRSSSIHGKGIEKYHVEVEQFAIEALETPTLEILRRGAQAIRKVTGWEDPVDAVSIRAFLGEVQGEREEHDAVVEEKRGRTIEEDDVEEPASKRKPHGHKESERGEGPAAHTRQRPGKSPTFVHPGDGPLPKEMWEGPSTSKKGKEKEDLSKGKSKGPAYKLQSDIESSIDMKGILEERILDAKIEFTLREALGVAKRDFHELIIDIIKRKRQTTAEAIMVEALDTRITKDEEIEIGHAFALICDFMDTKESAANVTHEIYEGQSNGDVNGCVDILMDEEEEEILLLFAQVCANDKRNGVAEIECAIECQDVADKELEGVKNLEEEVCSLITHKKEERMVVKMTSEATFKEEIQLEANTYECAIVHKVEREVEGKMDYFHPFWARATTETRVKLGELEDSILALVDHGSEINIMSRKIYEKGQWPIDTNHGWVMRAANNGRGELYGACPAVPTRIGDVEVEQNFFVQNYGAYPIILGQPYITASRMETKVLDDGSHYARIRSCDGKRSIQFLTVRPINERHRVHLREGPLPTSLDFADF